MLCLLLASAFFSASETAISTFNKIRMKNKADKGDRRAKAALAVAEDYDRTLSTILIGNNIVNMASASLATVAATAIFGSASGPAIATFVMTLLVLIFGEILPKTLARTHAERVSMLFSGAISVLRVVFTPVVWLFVQLNRLLTRRAAGAMEPSVTEEELKSILHTAQAEGVLNQQETGILHSVIEFDDTTVQEILTPRVDMVAVDVNAPEEEILQAALDSPYTRIPVYEEDPDHILGMLHTRDLFACLARHEPVRVRALCREVLFVYRTKPIDELLADFRRQKHHMAIVTDDYGGTLGLVTLEDVLEELVGEIFDETDLEDALPLEQLSDRLYRVSGESDIYDIFTQLDLSTEGLEDDCYTAAGWALEALGHIPSPGETFPFGPLTVTVERLEGKRILSLLLQFPPSSDNGPGASATTGARA